ncbi:MAG: ribosomal protein [Chlamydiota bacterium]|jgi:large subunit ribosomal protein L18
MIKELERRNVRRKRRNFRVRKAVRGNAERPRLCIFRSNKHVCAQLIDDEKGITLASAGTLSKEFRDRDLRKGKASARQVGVRIAELAKQKNIELAVFDRGFRKYHGLLAEVAAGARETGLQF